MNTFLGIFWLLFLFLLCFSAIHVIKLAQWGEKYRRQKRKGESSKPPVKETEEKKKEAPPQEPAKEPVYYIVERKRKTKSSFSEPKEIRFKQE